ncbi:MAG: hypothetical protein EA377_02370 [Phycisphaerales bacterium]|nr:MAG: hypothetical protein EA377_02370 [Phycisphaerales bacterium]
MPDPADTTGVNRRPINRIGDSAWGVSDRTGRGFTGVHQLPEESRAQQVQSRFAEVSHLVITARGRANVRGGNERESSD